MLPRSITRISEILALKQRLSSWNYDENYKIYIHGCGYALDALRVVWRVQDALGFARTISTNNAFEVKKAA